MLKFPTTKREQLHTDLTEKIIGAAIRVHTTLGPGFDEDIYTNALIVEFDKNSIQFENNWQVKVYYDAVNVGAYTLDFLVQDKVIVKVLASDSLDPKYLYQVKSHLAATELKVGLVLNFGGATLEIKRVEPRILKERTKREKIFNDYL